MKSKVSTRNMPEFPVRAASKIPAFTNVVVEGKRQDRAHRRSGCGKRLRRVVDKDDIVAQIEQILVNLRAALEAGGARPEQIIKWNIYVVEGQPLQAAFAAFQNTWAQDAQPAGHHDSVGIGSCASRLLGGDGARFWEVVCEVAFFKMCRLADVPIAESGYCLRWLRNGVGVFIFSYSTPLEKEIGMRRTFLLLFSVTVALLFGSGAVLALPSEKPGDTLMVDGRVRAIEQVGTNIWLGGRISRVEQRNGTVLVNVANVAVFDSKTEEYRKGVAPRLGGTGAEVFDMTLYDNDVLIAGNFPGPTSKERNLVLVDGATGEVIRWYDDSPTLKSVLAAPKLGRVHGGGRSLSAFDFATGTKLWTKAKTEVDVIHAHDSKPAYRDLELDADTGKTIWAACICD